MGIDVERTRVDHFDRDGLNDLRTNLRPATAAQNTYNIGLTKNNRSGHKGVSWYVAGATWEARIRRDGKQVFLGRFKDIGEAAHAYREAATELHGEFSRFE